LTNGIHFIKTQEADKNLNLVACSALARPARRNLAITCAGGLVHAKFSLNSGR